MTRQKSPSQIPINFADASNVDKLGFLKKDEKNVATKAGRKIFLITQFLKGKGTLGDRYFGFWANQPKGTYQTIHSMKQPQRRHAHQKMTIRTPKYFEIANGNKTFIKGLGDEAPNHSIGSRNLGRSGKVWTRYTKNTYIKASEVKMNRVEMTSLKGGTWTLDGWIGRIENTNN